MVIFQNTHHIRCIKPNGQQRGKCFEEEMVRMQLKYSGLTSVLELMSNGYPLRLSLIDLYDKYKPFLSPKLRQMEPKKLFGAIFHAIGTGVTRKY